MIGLGAGLAGPSAVYVASGGCVLLARAAFFARDRRRALDA